MMADLGVFQIFYHKGNVNNRVLHVRGIVDNKFICRRWRPGRGWTYEMLDASVFTYNKDSIKWRSCKTTLRSAQRSITISNE